MQRYYHPLVCDITYSDNGAPPVCKKHLVIARF